MALSTSKSSACGSNPHKAYSSILQILCSAQVGVWVSLLVPSLPPPLVIDRLHFSWEPDLPELSLHFSASLDVVGPVGCGGHDLRVCLGAVQGTEPTLGVPNKIGLPKVSTCKIMDRAGRGEMVE